MILRPQEGPQEKFLSTNADIAIYGGAAGGGKTYALLLEPLRYMNVDGYSATIFRKNATQISIDGGLLDESMSIYGFLRNAVYKASPKPHWFFNDKAKVSFMHIDGDRDLPKWQGSQICCTLDTPVLMADETYKDVGDLQIGDYVMTLQGAQKITAACEPILKDCVEVELPNGEKQVQSTNHCILTKYGWVSYDDLISSQSITNCSSQKFCGYKNNLRLIPHILQLNDVVIRNQADLRFCAKDRVPKDSHHILRYVHPYTGEEQIAEVDHLYQTLKVIPCGKKLVRNICVASSNHYITKCGLINKNCFIGFDELCHFSQNQFFYMLSRNRSVCGVKPYVRATCNPDVDSWVAEFISWWINPETGYPIQERSGVLRYFCRVEGAVQWGDSPSELVEKYGIDAELCKSVTFIASSVYDNKILLENDPSYLANLHGLSLVERERLLNGNWKIRPSAGLYFKAEQTRIVKSVPDSIVAIVRAWDLAATEINIENKDPDRTAGVLMGRMANGQYIVLDVKRIATNASHVRAIVKNTAETDKAEYNCRRIQLEQDPGQAGKEQVQSYIRFLAGYNVKSRPVSGSKITRAEPFAAQWQQGNVLLLEGSWNETFLDELEGFPDALHDDQVDAASDAFSVIAYARARTIGRGDFGL